MRHTLLFLFIAFALPAAAQQIKVVSGKVLNKTEGMKKAEPFPPSEKVYIYGFNTVADGRDAAAQLKSGGTISFSADAETTAGPDGYYEISVAETGMLVVRVAMATETREVNYNQEINMNIDGGIIIQEVKISAPRLTPEPEPVAGTMIGNNLIVSNTFPIPKQFGKATGRLIIQPYVMDCKTADTVALAKPWVFDGVDYGLTQDRRMAFNPDNDPLTRYVQRRPLSEERFDIPWSDTIYIANPKKAFTAHCVMILEDYTRVSFKNDMKLTTCGMRRPLQFLEFSFPFMQVDPEKYKQKPRRERRNTAKNVSLSFLVGKAQLDPEDPKNEEQLGELRADLLGIVNGEGTTLKALSITGVSSPEGRYAPNLALARQRTATALGMVTQVIPKRTLDRVFVQQNARVAGWDEVAALLEADTLPEAAARVREVVAKYPKSPDAQFAAIARMDIYPTIIKERLPRLRTVLYEYKHEVFRELNPDEILARYENEPDYRSGKKSFTLYEYWYLFKMVKDPKQLEALYLRAYNDSKAMLGGKPWVLAANNLAVSYLERDTFDVEILKPLIDLGVWKVNQVQRFDDGISVTETEVNPEAVVANQLAMYIRSDNFREASILAKLLPDEERFKLIKAFARCLGGYYVGGATVEEANERREVFETVRATTPLNNIVMCLAMNKGSYNAPGEEAARRAAARPGAHLVSESYLRQAAQRCRGCDDGGGDELGAMLPPGQEILCHCRQRWRHR